MMLAMSSVSVPTLLSILLLVATAAGEGGHGARAVGGDEATTQYYMSASEVTAYWHSVFPNSSIPPAILHHLKAPAAEKANPNTESWSRTNMETGDRNQGLPLFSWNGLKNEKEGKKDGERTESNEVKEANPNTESWSRTNMETGDRNQGLPLFSWHALKNEKGGKKDGERTESNEVKEGKQPGGVHEASHNHDHSGSGNLCFLEDVLAPGSLVAPHIAQVTGNFPFLRRDVADSIPISSDNFTDILRMFAPESLSIADDIRFFLKLCEHHILLKGEQQGCPTSMESMVELVTTVLGTRDIRAFSSSPNLPAEGIASAPQGYTVVSARKITAGMEGEAMTCHGATFPFAVFYCHAMNPTRVYDVTLRRTKEGGAAAASGITTTTPATIRAVAVCHLDTSDFDPKHPCFMEWGLKPGEAPLCHFVGRDAIVWAPAAGHVAAQ